MIFAAEKKSMKKHNFSAGPAILPQEVFHQAAEAVRDLDGSGLSLIEISHRSKAFVNIMEEACALSLELSGLENTTYRALFLQGGASSQFLMTAYNLLENKLATSTPDPGLTKPLKKQNCLEMLWSWLPPKRITIIISLKN